MKTHSPTTHRLLRPTSSMMKHGTAVKIGPQSDACEPTIKINRSEKGVESIEVTCACGEQMLIRCDYE